MNHHSAHVVTENERFLEFKLGQEMYAIPLLSIKEVISVPETTPIPNSPAHFVGIMNLRGQVITVIDLRKRLSIKANDDKRENAVVIVNIEDVQVGMVVDAIHKVFMADVKTDMQSLPDVAGQVNQAYMRGVLRIDDRLVVLLDLTKVLNVGELGRIKN